MARMESHVSVAEAARAFPEMIERVHSQGEVFIVEQGGEPRAHGVAVGGPLAHARGVLRVLAQPGFDLLARFGRAVEFAVDPGAEPFVVEGLRVHRHTTRRSAVPAGLPWPSSSPRKVARARHTRDITVPTGMRITSATSA